MTQQKSIQEISRNLWQMADELRGNMDANEYKTYILSFIFYKYLSEKQEQYFIDNNILEQEYLQKHDNNINNAYKEYLNDEEELSYIIENTVKDLGYAIRPENTWATLKQKIKDNEVVPSDYKSMFDSFEEITQTATEHTSDFKGIFSDINLSDSRLGSDTTQRARTLNAVVNIIDEQDFKSVNGRNVLADVYEYLIGQFAANSGQKGGEFYTPHQVSKILAKIVTEDVDNTQNSFTVFDPTMGSGSLLLTVGEELPDKKRIEYYGQELNTTTYNIAKMNLIMNDVDYNRMHLNNADTLEADWPPSEDNPNMPRTFDAIVANPPYSAKWDNNKKKMEDPRFAEYGKLAPKSYADFAFVLHSLYHLKQEGKMAVVLPHGVLFRSNAEATIRQKLIEKNYIDTIIGLAPNLFYGAGIATSIVVFDKNKENKDILFIEASNLFTKGKTNNYLEDEHIDKILKAYKDRKDVDKFASLIDFDTIKENDFNLNINRYVDTSEDEVYLELDEVFELLDNNKNKINEIKESLMLDFEKLDINYKL